MDWITENYSNIIQWGKNMTKGDELSEELCHYAIEVLLHHKRYQEIIDKHNADPEFGHLRAFLLAIMRNSWYGKKSEFSRYHKAHRADIGHRKREITDEHFDRLLDVPEIDYDHDKDRLIEAIEGLLEEMTLDQDKLWYSARLFQMWLKTPNYSELSRQTDIPRTSISNAVAEAREYILQELKNRNII
tara:strand:+ start:790 stop:1353 length:564 start_codon:yes stop_codon:yes gene_type:complete